MNFHKHKLPGIKKQSIINYIRIHHTKKSSSKRGNLIWPTWLQSSVSDLTFASMTFPQLDTTRWVDGTQLLHEASVHLLCYPAPTQHLHSTYTAWLTRETRPTPGKKIPDRFPIRQPEVNSMRSSLDTMVGPFKCHCGIWPLPVFRAGFLPVRTQLHTGSMCSFSFRSALINQSLNSYLPHAS